MCFTQRNKKPIEKTNENSLTSRFMKVEDVKPTQQLNVDSQKQDKSEKIVFATPKQEQNNENVDIVHVTME